MRAASLMPSQVQSVRFDKSDSPPFTNGGDGWTREDALRWLADHDLDDLMRPMEDDEYCFRAKRFESARLIEAKTVDRGVVVIRCEKR